MKKHILLFISGILFIAMQVSAGTWTKKANLPAIARYLPASFSIGTKGYVGCGMKGTASNVFNDFWEWDQATNTWTQKANFAGTPRQAPIGFAIGNKGYMGSGVDASANAPDFYEYDPSTNTWTKKANVPVSGNDASVAFSIGTKGYVGTGSNGGTYYNDFYEYDPVADTWTAKASVGIAGRCFASAFAVNGKGYIGLGSTGGVATKDMWEWDPSTNTWTQKANFTPGRWFGSGFSIGNYGYISAGMDSTGKCHNDLWQFDPVANTWTQLTNFPGSVRYGATAFSIGCKGYITEGLNLGTVVYQNDMYEYSTCIPPTAAFSMDAKTVCAGTTVNFTDISTGSPSSWSWSFPGGTPSSSTLQNPSVTYNTSGTYSVSLTASNSNGSNTLDSAGCIIVIAKPVPNAGKDTTICTGSSVALSASGGTTYSWTALSGGSSTLNNTAVFNPVASPTVTTTYVVSVGNSTCPAGTDTVIVNVQNIPVVDAGAAASICNGSETTLSGTGTGPFVWLPAAGLNCTACPDPVATPTITTVYTLTSGSGGCTAKDSVKITVKQNPVVSAGNDTTISEGGTAMLSASGTASVSYSWTPGAGLSCTACAVTNASPTASTSYTVIAIDTNGCTATDVMNLNVDLKCADVFVPTAFSPNGDGHNDFECVRGPCVISLHFVIHDRWGQLVFESDDQKQCWDGYYNGKPMDSGVFIYYLTATMEDGKTIAKQGNITLVR